MSDYLELDKEQREVLNREFAKVHYWHRVNHLSAYSDFTLGLMHSFSDGVKSDRLEMVFAQITSWVDEVEEKMTPLIVEIMVSLTDEQVRKIPVRLEKGNIKIAAPELHGDLDDVKILWAEELEGSLRQFVGRLTDHQKAYIGQRADREVFENGYRALIEARESYYGEELSAVFAANQRLNLEVSVYILNHLKDRQLARFTEELRELSEDFAELSKQADA